MAQAASSGQSAAFPRRETKPGMHRRRAKGVGIAADPEAAADGGLPPGYEGVGTRTPFPRQAAFLEAVLAPEWRYIGYGGAMGGGKTSAIAQAALLLSVLFPGNVGLVGRKDFPDLRATTYQEVLDTIPAQLVLKHHQTQHWIDVRTLTKPGMPLLPSRIMFEQLKDYESHKSLNLGWFAIDEATEVAQDAWLLLISRLRRPGIPERAYKAIAGTNPGPGWFKETFVEPMKLASKTVFIKSLARDNPFLPSDYVDNLRQHYPEIWVKRFLEGDWSAFEGQIFTEWDRALHVIAPFQPPPGWPVWGGLDYGATNPTACLWMTRDWDGNVYVFHEYYQALRTPRQQAADITAFGPPMRIIYADPATRAKTLERAGIYVSIMDEWRALGLPVVPANNEVMAGIMKLKTLLTPQDARIHPRTGHMGAPQLYVCSHCINTIRSIENLAWQKAAKALVNAPDAPVDFDDHATDALRYGLMGPAEGAQVGATFSLESIVGAIDAQQQANTPYDPSWVGYQPGVAAATSDAARWTPALADAGDPYASLRPRAPGAHGFDAPPNDPFAIGPDY